MVVARPANILYALALDNRLKGHGVRATALHPGGIQTELGRHMTPELRAQIQKRIAASKEAATFGYKKDRGNGWRRFRL
jgi:NAD(P)-dependent dehydrogenase (short-subunit alcohol dehydrogenase family)